ncbi:hypothetical protein EJ04DRAFT_595087 [Polyplosphaeria fusca]|uniref:Uncharacterized protein n=1 Tax=Polyplosphaeria fusca TaxID=682080 RepID=A0A9P4V3Q4_9PLEO|nr:hypothetical protein EJ04DRAFT_595087 [Polyplosphaeria fusca]
MLSRKFFFTPSVFTLFLASAHAADPTYWVDQSCKDRVGFEDALNEVIWSSGDIVNALQARDERLRDPLKWLFNIFLDDLEDTPQLEMMTNTFRRVSSLKSSENQQISLLRLMCDGGESFNPKDLDGKEALKDPLDRDGIRIQVYHDEGNDVWEKGGNIPCKILEDEVTVLAQTHPFVQRRNEDLLIDASSSQPAERVIIGFCDALFEREGPKENPLWWLPTFREAGREDAPIEEAIATIFSSHLAKTIMHEFAHVPFLSRQDSITWPVDNVKHVSTVGAHGRDYHGPTKENGYYFYEDAGANPPLNSFPGPRLYNWQHTVMNPDSYGYMLLLYRFIQKQWKPNEKRYDADKAETREDGPVVGIGFEKTQDWELQGDWPGAGETPAWGSRNPDFGN